MLSLAVGLAALFAVGGSRLQMFANLLLAFGPLVWLVSRASLVARGLRQQQPLQARSLF